MFNYFSFFLDSLCWCDLVVVYWCTCTQPNAVNQVSSYKSNLCISRGGQQSASSEEVLPQHQLSPQTGEVGAGVCLFVCITYQVSLCYTTTFRVFSYWNMDILVLYRQLTYWVIDRKFIQNNFEDLLLLSVLLCKLNIFTKHKIWVLGTCHFIDYI